MTRKDLERALVELRAPAGALEAALAEVRRERFVERDAFTRFYVRERLQGVGHAAALAASVKHARAVGVPVVRVPADRTEDEADVDTGLATATRSTPAPRVAPAVPVAPPTRSWLSLLAALWLLAAASVVGLLMVVSTSRLEVPPPPELAIPAPTGDLTQRVAVIGRAGSGKSVFLARLFRHFQDEVNHNPAASWTVDVEAKDARDYIEETEAVLRRSEWPTRSADLVVAAVRERGSNKAHHLQVWEASEGSAGAESLEPRSVMLVVDGARLDAPETWHLEEFLVRHETSLGRSDLPRASWLAVVISKADQLASLGEAPEQIARTFAPGVTLTRLRRCFRWVRVFAVSAVGKTLGGPDGQRLPDPHALPVGLEEPLLWLLEGRKAYEAERQAQTVERQHAADDAGSEVLWKKQETARRARARRRRIGAIIIVAASVAAFTVLAKAFG